jgi:tetratricopeptide repeat protein/surface antigen-like variable number repeat protein
LIAAALAAILLLAEDSAVRDYDALVAQGISLGREGRLEEAARAFDAAIATDPSRPEGRVERGGLLFLEKRYDEAARDLREALRLREDAYTRDLLGSSLHLAGRSDEALAVWNVQDRPVVGEVEISGLVHTLDPVARREVAVAPGQVLTLASVRETRLRLTEAGIFDRVTVRPVPRGDGKADVEVALLERYGFFRNPVDLALNAGTNLLFERVRPRFWNIGGRGISVGGQYRWEANRPDLSLQIDWARPVGLGANLRLSAFRGRQLYDLDDGPLQRRSRGLDAGLRRVLGSRTVAQLVFRTRDREFSRPDPDAPPGNIIGFEAGLERQVLDTRRHHIDASVRLFGSGHALGSDLTFARAAAWASYRLYLSAPEGVLIEPSVLAAQVHWGRGGSGMPIDEMFAPGASPEMELPLRAHHQDRDGALGATPLGRRLTLVNTEWRRRVLRSTWFQAGIVLFYDGAWISASPDSSDQDHSLHDVGMGIRLGFVGSSTLRFDFGHGLSDGNNAFSFGLNQTF